MGSKIKIYEKKRIMNKIELLNHLRNEIVAFFKKNDYTLNDSFTDSEWNDEYFYDGDEVAESLKFKSWLKNSARLDNIKLVDSYGGEGKGDNYYKVFEIIIDDVSHFLKFHGYYDSWNGTEWEGVYKVEPKQVTITDYVKIEE